MFHADGRLAAGAIALRCRATCSLPSASPRLAEALGSAPWQALRNEAATLQERFEAAFWCPDLSTYALALDGAKRPCRVRSSNAGQVLLSGLASPERAASTARGLMDRDCFSGWGIRTVAETAARYNPMSYHNGSVWPHDNALIALGFAHYGLSDHILRLFGAMFDAAGYMDLRRLPELFVASGACRARDRRPTRSPARPRPGRAPLRSLSCRPVSA